MTAPAPASAPIALADLAAELGTTTTALATRVTRLVGEHGPGAVIHTPHPSNRRTLLHPAAADLLRHSAATVPVENLATLQPGRTGA